MELNESIVWGFLRSEEQFPIDFDIAWSWLGYTRKSDAKSALLNAGFVDGIDFRVLRNIPQNSKVGRPPEEIQMTVDCFKSFAMMAGTTKGREVRCYFLNCEKRLKELLQCLELEKKKRVVRALVSGDYTRWERRFEKEFFDEAYRVTGWQPTHKGHPSCMGRFIKNHI